MAGVLEGLIGGLAGAGTYLANSAAAEQSWKEKEDYQNAKLEAQRQLAMDKMENSQKMLEQRLEAKMAGSGGGKGVAFPKTDDEMLQLAATSGMTVPQIKEYLAATMSGEMPTRTEKTLTGGRDFRGPPTEVGPAPDAENTYSEAQVLDEEAAQRISKTRGVFGDMVLRNLNPKEYGGVMTGDEQRHQNKLLDAAIKSKDPKAIESLTVWNRAIKGQGNYAGGENVLTGRAGQMGQEELSIKQQRAAADASEAETRRRTADYAQSEEGRGSKINYRRNEVQRSLESVIKEIDSLRRSMGSAKLAERAEIQSEIDDKIAIANDFREEIASLPRKPSSGNVPNQGAGRNLMTGQIPKVGR